MAKPPAKLTPKDVFTDMLKRGLIRQTAVGVFTITEQGRAAMKPFQDADLAHRARPAAIAQGPVPGGPS
jgi:hypothetical protein